MNADERRQIGHGPPSLVLVLVLVVVLEPLAAAQGVGRESPRIRREESHAEAAEGAEGTQRRRQPQMNADK